MCMCLTEAFLLCLNLKRIKFTRLELAAAAVSPKHTDIIHKTLKRAPQHDVIYREVEKKICDVVAKMAAPLSTMKFWKPGK